MGILVRRFLMLVMLPVGLILLAAPLNTSHTDYNAISEDGSYEVEVPGLRTVLRVAGGMSLLFALFTLWGLYRVPGDGMRVQPVWVPVLQDGITLAFLTVGAWALVEEYLYFYLRFSALDYKPPPWFFTLLGLGGVAVMTVFISLFAAQTVRANAEAITVHGLLGKTTLPWTGIETFKLSSTGVITAKGGIPMRREVERPLVIEGPAGSITIHEPQTSGAKDRLENLLLRHVPDSLRSKLADTLAEWR